MGAQPPCRQTENDVPSGMAEEREPAESHRHWRELGMGRAEQRVSVKSGCVVVERQKDYEVLLTGQSEELRKMAVACKRGGVPEGSQDARDWLQIT